MKSRSTRLFTLGIAVFVVGAGLVFVAMRPGSDAKAPARSAPAAAKPAQAGQKVRAAGGATGKALVQMELPKGMEGFALSLRGAPGLAGYAKPGDRVNLYATVKSAPKSENPPLAKLVAAELEVLGVTALTPGSTGEATYMLAVPAGDAERLIFFARFESLWFTLAHPDQGHLQTRGAGYANSI